MTRGKVRKSGEKWGKVGETGGGGGFSLSLWECWWEAYLWTEWEVLVFLTLHFLYPSFNVPPPPST